jgi:hypothetical protein
MSKGSKQRPIQDKEQFDKNWNAIFKKTPCQHKYEFIYDGDIGSGWFCKLCGLKLNDN